MAKKEKSPKADELQALTPTESFFDRYRKLFLYGAAGIVVIVLGYVGYQKFVVEPHMEESQDAYWNAFYDFENNDTSGTAITGTENYMGFEEIAETYAGTTGGNIAAYAMGIDAMEKGEYEQALEYFDEVEFEDVMLGTLVIGLQGDCYVELKEYEKAAEKFEEAAAREQNEFTSPMFYKKAGLVYQELGQHDKAVIAYQKIKDEWSGSVEAADIDKYIIRAQN